jgi:hypothetical protein
VVGPVAATSASWAYEARQAYLARVLKHVPLLADALRSGGVQTSKDGEPVTITTPLWTGEYDSEGLPIPAENPAWFHEVWPVYNGPDPQENKRRSLRDTLIVSPESGPRLIACGLWTGERDDAGLPIPTPPAPDRSRR